MFENSDLYVSGDVTVDKIYCSGKILIEDLGNRFESHEQAKIETGMSNLYHWSNTFTASDLFISGNIIFNERFYDEKDVFQLVKPVTSKVHPKTMIIKCNNFLMSHKFIIKDNYIHTTNDEMILKLRQMKIKKIRKND